MIKVSVEFQSFEEVAAFATHASQAGLKVTVGESVPPVIEDKPKASRSRAKKEETHAAPQTFSAPANEPMEDVKSPYAAPQVTPAQPTGINRDAYLGRIKQLVEAMKSAGVEKGQMTSLVNSCVAHAGGTVGTVAKDFGDDLLVRFVPILESAVMQLLKPAAPAQAAPQASSFI